MNAHTEDRLPPPDRAASRCPRCESGVLIRRHCKTLCLDCGYVESCEDNFIPLVEPPRDGSSPDVSG